MPNGMSERSVLIEHCGVGGSVRKDTLYPIQYIVRPCSIYMKFKEFPIISTMKRVWISYAHVTFASSRRHQFAGVFRLLFFNGLKYMDNLQLSTKP